MNLYQLTTDFNRYMDAETDEELASALADITAVQIQDKATHYCQFLTVIDGEIERFKAEEKRIAAARKAMENKVERVKEYMKSALEAADIYKLDAGTFKISVSPSQGKLVIDDASVIPAQYIDVITTVTPRNSDIKEAIKNGVDVPGAHIEPGTTLRIR